jgi:hypothetical protein
MSLLATRTPNVAARLGLALLFFFALDALAFRTGYYRSILNPDSTAGFLETYLSIENHRPLTCPRQALAVGDSRMGLKARIANALMPETNLEFGTIAVPGSTPRCWYYMLRDIDPRADRYAAIVIGLDSYDDRSFEDHNERELDINYLTPLVGFGDLIGFAASYQSWPLRLHAAESVLFKGLAYQRDFQSFLGHPRTRLQIAAVQHRSAAEWFYNSVWEQRSLAGMSVDWDAHKLALPDWVSPQKRQEIEERVLSDPPPYFDQLARYRRRWLGAILDRYRGSRTKIIFLQLPRGPVVRPGLTTDAASSIRDFAAAGKALLMDPRQFDSLEHPEFFGDAMHLNEAGAIRFTGLVARETNRMLIQAGR